MSQLSKYFSTVTIVVALSSGMLARAAPPQKSIQVLVQQGNTALANQDFDAARHTFDDVLARDPKNSAAMAGLGIAYSGLKDYAKAAPLLDKAAMSNPNDRVIAYDAAAADIDNNAAMRGAKILKDYLQSHPTAPDEPMGNALAIALGNADEQARKNSFYQVVAAFYKMYNAKLEAAAPGMKRWGIEWISAAKYADKQAEIQSKQKRLDEAKQNILASDAKIAGLNQKVPVLTQRVQSGFATQYELDSLNQQIAQEQDIMTKEIADRDDVLASIPKPSIPLTLDCVTADAMPPAAIDTVAFADNSVPPVKGVPAPKAKPKPAKRAIPTPGDPTGAGSAADSTANDPPIVPKGMTGQSDQTPAGPETSVTDSPTPDPQPAAAAKRAIVTQYAAAFPVAPDLLVTAAAPLAGATQIELLTVDGNPMQAELVRADGASGLALLRLTVQKIAYVPLATAFSGGSIQCAAFPAVDLFNPVVELLNGSAPAPSDGWKVRLGKHPRLPGAPLLVAGQVVGVQLGNSDDGNDALPAATLAQLKAFLGADLPATPGTASPAAVLLEVKATKGGDLRSFSCATTTVRTNQ